MSKPQLVIVTTHFGTNFSGGSTATCEVFKQIECQFSQIVVVGTKLGEHAFKNLRFIEYQSVWHLHSILKELRASDNIYYGDFYNAYIFPLVRVPFYFTYHDNWPELGKVSFNLRVKGIAFWAIYRYIFSYAQHVFVVSSHKLNQVKKYANGVSMVHNGINAQTSSDQMARKHVLMVGNIDQRKYAKSIELFDTILSDKDFSRENFRIDIYGHPSDATLVNKLHSYSFVNLCGHVNPVPFSRYSLLLHTSLMENLSMVWCEAVASNTPVLTFKVGGAEEVVSPTRGVLIQPYNLDQMYDALKMMLRVPKMFDGSDIHSDFSWEKASVAYSKRMLGDD